MCVIGGLIGAICAFPFFLARKWLYALDRDFAGQSFTRYGGQCSSAYFTELFGASYRYSGAGVGYQVASIVGADSPHSSQQD